MRKLLTLMALLLGTFLVQGTLRIVLPAQYMIPNLLVILTCSMGLMRGKKAGLWMGFLAGCLYDLFFGEFFGLSALCLMYVGYLNGFLCRIFFDNDVRIPMATVAVGDFACNLLLYLARLLQGATTPFHAALVGMMLPETIASVLCTIVLYPLYRSIHRSLLVSEAEAQQSPWLRG